MELITIVILCLLVYASWATTTSNSLFHRTWSLALLLLPFLFISLWLQPPSALVPLLTTLLLLDLTFCVALSPVRLLFRSKHATERHNALDVLYDEPNAVADIVVVHGLASRPNETWRARPAKSSDAVDCLKENSAPPTAPLWLSDFLPKENLKCRILAFNHNTAWESNSLSKSLEDHGRDLLRALGRYREQQREKERPIIFIGHSFGGIIIKQAVVIGQRLADDDYRGNIARRTQGFIFLGTPHDGSSLTLPGKLLTLINHWEGSSDSLLQIIEPGSEANSRLHKDFLACYNVAIMVCFFEAVRETLWDIPLMHAVERKSAEIAGAEIIGSEKQHRDLQRFSSTNDNEYQDLVFSIKNLLGKASVFADDYFDLPVVASTNTLQGRKKLLDYLNEFTRFSKPSFYYTTESGIERASDDESTEWFLQSQEMSTWRSDGEPQFLWHSGPPQSGKTRLSWYLIKCYLEQNAAFELRLAHFFHPEIDNTADPGNYAFQSLTPNNIILSIIVQLIGGSDDLMQRIPPEHQQRLLAHCQSPLPEQDVIFWETIKVLIQTMAESEMAPIIIFDGIDRLHPDQRKGFLRGIRNLWDNIKDFGSTIKILISSRPYPDIHGIIGHLPSINPEKESIECLNSLLSHSKNKRRTTITPGDSQTGDWLWSDKSYENWNNSSDSTLLWIQGKPGSGKSTLSKMILDKLLLQHNLALAELHSSMDGTYSSTRRLPAKRRERTPLQNVGQTTKKPVVIATFFYSIRGAKTEASHVQMLHSLLYQILWQERGLYPLFREKYHEVRQISSQQTIDSPWTFEDLWSILMALMEFDGFPITVYLLIDGLDESERTGERYKTLSLLGNLHSKTSQCLVKSVLASRPDNDIKGTLAGFPQIILEDKNRGDIEKVITSKVDSLRQAGEDDRRILTFMKQYLADNAQGVFLWVELVSEELKALFQRGITVEELQSALTNLPRDLEPFYERIVKQLTVGTPTDEAKRMLRWATFALRPLTVEEFRDAIAIPASADENLIIDIKMKRLSGPKDVQLRLQHNCGGLLEIRQKTGLKRRDWVQEQDTIQLLHRTVRDFLLHPSKAAEPFYMEDSKESGDIALVCVRYLKMVMENVAAEPPVPGWSDDDYYNFFRCLSSWPLLPYIIRFLPRHLEDTQTHVRDAQNFATSFMEKIKHNTGHPALSLMEPWLRNLGLLALDYSDCQAAATFRNKCLDIAASSGNLNIAMVILDVAESPKARDTKDNSSFSTALYNTAITGHASVVQLLLDKGADVDAKGGDSGGNALQAASFNGNLETVGLLLANGADINARGGSHGNALQAAIVGGYPDVIQLLLHNGADVNARGGEKYDNALQAAALGGRVDIVELLVDSGADVSAHGRSALLAAATSGHLEIVELLLQMGTLMIEEDAGKFFDGLLKETYLRDHQDITQFLLAKRASFTA